MGKSRRRLFVSQVKLSKCQQWPPTFRISSDVPTVQCTPMLSRLTFYKIHLNPVQKVFDRCHMI